MEIRTDELLELVDPRRTAVLAVDVQQAFSGFPTLYPSADATLPRLQQFLTVARDAGVTVIMIQAIIPDESYSEVWQRQFRDAPQVRAFLAPGSPGVQFHPGFEPQPGDIILTKHRYSAFFGTPLDSILRTRGIRTVLACGLTTDVCVGSTARDAYQHDYTVITLSDCTAEASQVRYDAALQTLATNFGAVLPSTDVMNAWSTASANRLVPQHA